MEESSHSEDNDHDDSPIYRPGSSPQQDTGDEFRNPEPPHELGQSINADNIGDTVFSKHWLFTTLMNLIQTVESQENSKKDLDADGGLDIEESLQDDLCKLWDMSMNPEVVKFLQEFQALDILTGVIAKSRAPRATEICVGILGNMACEKDVCQQIADNSKLVNLLLMLFEDPDAPTLVELTRLLHSCISSGESASKKWVEHIQRNQAIFTHISFILQSSTNRDLILNTADFVDKLMDISEAITRTWSNGELVLCCLEANKQVGGESGIENVDTFLHVLQLVSTCEPGVEALLSYGTDLLNVCMKYLRDICSDEVVGFDGKENSIGSALSVINVLLSSWEDSMKFLQEDYELLRCVLKILEEVYPHYNKKRAKELRRMRSRSLSRSHSSPPNSFSSDKSTQDMNISHGSDQSESQEVTRDGQVGCHGDDGSIHTETVEISDKDLHKPQANVHFSIETKSETESIEPSVSNSNHNHEQTVVSDTTNDKQVLTKQLSSSTIQMLYDVIQTCLSETIHVLQQILNKTSDRHEDIPLGVPECLDYLDTKCPTIRLQYMINSIQSTALAEDSQSKDLLQIFKSIVRKYKLERIEKVLLTFHC